eukprot:m.311961 g.311961  ORF g.311961 m.311961 type:complete len:437 (+) comp27456_c0_seq1:693-2003(+)
MSSGVGLSSPENPKSSSASGLGLFGCESAAVAVAAAPVLSFDPRLGFVLDFALAFLAESFATSAVLAGALPVLLSFFGFSAFASFSLSRFDGVFVDATAAGFGGSASPEKFPTPAASTREACFFIFRRMTNLMAEPPDLESSCAAWLTCSPVSGTLSTLITISPRANPASEARPPLSRLNTKISGLSGSPSGPPPPHTFIPMDDPFGFDTVISIDLRFARWGFGGSLRINPSESFRFIRAPGAPERPVLVEFVCRHSSHDWVSLCLIVNLRFGQTASIVPLSVSESLNVQPATGIDCRIVLPSLEKIPSSCRSTFSINFFGLFVSTPSGSPSKARRSTTPDFDFLSPVRVTNDTPPNERSGADESIGDPFNIRPSHLITPRLSTAVPRCSAPPAPLQCVACVCGVCACMLLVCTTQNPPVYFHLTSTRNHRPRHAS